MRLIYGHGVDHGVDEGVGAGAGVGFGDRAEPCGAPELLDDEALARVYAHPSGDEAGTSDGVWWRVNMVTSLDGAGIDVHGHSAGFGSDADQRVFHLLRRLCDAVVVGAGTARAEEYGLAAHCRLVVVSRHGEVPESVAAALTGPPPALTPERASTAAAADSDRVLFVTCQGADDGALARSRALLGTENVLVSPSPGHNSSRSHGVDQRWLRARLAERGLRRVLAEGGPSLLGDQLEAGVVDELCLTVSPLLAGGPGGRIVARADLGEGLHPRLASMVESDGVLLTRWILPRS